MNNYFCEPICNKELPFENILKQECVDNCQAKDFMNGVCIINYKIDDENKKENDKGDTIVQDLIIKNLENSLISGDYNLSNVENGKDDIYQDEKMILTLTTTSNQKNNKNNNYTIIDLGECESLLRQENNISDIHVLYIKKIDVFQEGMRIPKIEYDIFYKSSENKLVKLNLSICRKSKISLFIPVEITENLDKLNSSSNYYNDICYIATSDNGTDIILKDRKKEFIEGNRTLCQDDCDFTEYYFNSQQAKCLCKVKESKLSIKDMKINKTKLYESFTDIENIINFKIMICYKILFTKNGIIYNIAFYFILLVILFHIIVIIIFYSYQKNIIDKETKDIISSINNLNIDNNTKIKRKSRKRRKRRKSIDRLGIKNTTNKIQNIIKSNNDNLLNIIKLNNPPNKNQRNIPVKRQNDYKINNNNNDTNKNNKNSYSRLKNNRKNKEIKQKSEQIIERSQEEINNLSYELALKLDKRTFCEYYCSLIKIKHILIFSFYNNNDYNIRIIKIDLFFIIFILYYMVNALFFDDNTMHKIYEDQGSL